MKFGLCDVFSNVMEAGVCDDKSVYSHVLLKQLAASVLVKTSNLLPCDVTGMILEVHEGHAVH